MVCKHCGREIDNNSQRCPYCSLDSSGAEGETAASDCLSYESNLGFAKANSLYEPPEVMDLRRGTVGSHDGSVGNEGSRQPSGNNQASRGRKSKKERKHSPSIGLPLNQSRRREKSITVQQRQRLYEELKGRLKEEQQESLIGYMYRGLNTDIVEGLEESQNKKRRDKSVLISMAGIILGVLIAAVLLIYMGSMNENSDYRLIAKDAIEIYTNQEDGKTYIFNAMGDLLYKTEGYDYISYTPDHTAAILYNWYTRSCAYVNAFRLKEFTSNIDKLAISEDGNYLVYSIPGGMNKNYLMLFDLIHDKETLIDNQAKLFDMLNIMPGGKAITYITFRLSENGSIVDLTSHIIQNGSKSELSDENMFVFGSSKDLSSIYYGKYLDNRITSMYVRHNGEDRQLSNGMNGIIHFNYDMTEILIEDNGSYYHSSQGGAPSKVSEKLINRIIMPNKAMISEKNNGGVVTYGIDSFKEKLILCNDNSIYYLNDKLQLKEIGVTGDISSITLSPDKEELFFLDQDQRLIKASELKGKVKKVVLATAVTDYEVLKDTSKLYYLQDKSLYYLEGKKKEKRISDNVEELCRNEKGDTVFFLKDYKEGKGTLYYSQRGLAEVPIVGGINVTALGEWNFGVIYQKTINNSNAVFYNRDGTDFTFIMDGIDLLNTEAPKE